MKDQDPAIASALVIKPDFGELDGQTIKFNFSGMDLGLFGVEEGSGLDIKYAAEDVVQLKADATPPESPPPSES